MSLELLHHDGSASGFDWFTVVIGVVVVLVLAVVAFVIYKVVQRRNQD